MTFFKWGSRQAEAPLVPDGPGELCDVVAGSKVLPRFLSAVERGASPVLVDLGPVVGTNVELFGERLACKLLVLDLCQEVERTAGSEESHDLMAAIEARVPETSGSVDGILCWDLFDYLDDQTSAALAGRLARALKPGGVLHAFFATAADQTDHYTRFVVEAEDVIRHRVYPATPRRRRVLSPRDIDRMFEGLDMVEHVLLKTRSRETLFRKR